MKQITNLIVRRRDGNSYCIQYLDNGRIPSNQKRLKSSNESKTELIDNKEFLEINIVPKECPILTRNNFFGFGPEHQRRKTLHGKWKSRGSILSNTLGYRGPCQAALTDAASVSKASLTQLFLSFKKSFNVIMVVILYLNYVSYFVPA